MYVAVLSDSLALSLRTRRLLSEARAIPLLKLHSTRSCISGRRAASRRVAPLSGPESAFECLARSLLLLQLLAFGRLLLFTAPQRPGQELRNKALVRGRRALCGAPLALAFAFCIVGAVAAPPGPLSASAGLTNPAVPSPQRSGASFDGQTSHVVFDVSLPSAVPTVDAPCQARPSVSSPPAVPTVDAPCQARPSAFGAFVETRAPESPIFSRVRAVGWNTPVVILQFQRLHLSVPVHTATVRDAEELEELAADVCEAYALGLALVHVDPQPDKDFPVLLGVSTHAAVLGRVPVCMHLYGPSDGPRIWMEYLESPVRLSDVQDVLGSDWQVSSRVFVHESGRPLTEDGQPIWPGMLIRVVPRGRSLPRGTSLTAKLARPDLFLRKLGLRGCCGRALPSATSMFGIGLPA